MTMMVNSFYGVVWPSAGVGSRVPAGRPTAARVAVVAGCGAAYPPQGGGRQAWPGPAASSQCVHLVRTAGWSGAASKEPARAAASSRCTWCAQHRPCRCAYFGDVH